MLLPNYSFLGYKITPIVNDYNVTWRCHYDNTVWNTPESVKEHLMDVLKKMVLENSGGIEYELQHIYLNDKEVYLQGDNAIIARREINRARTTMTGKKHKASIDLIYQYIKEYF